MSENKNTGGPAFPCDRRAVLEDNGWWRHGMTLRDYFAAKAMQGLLSKDSDWSELEANLASRSFELADAMLKARDL